MSTTLKLRGGSTAEHSTFTGEEREVTVDTQKNTVVVHDGSTVGGHPLVKESSLGTAATSDVTTSETDNTEGRLLKVGDFGLGSRSIDVGAIDLDQLQNNYLSGIYKSSSSNPNAPGTGEFVVFHLHGGGSNVAQIAIQATNTMSRDPSLKARCGGGTTLENKPWATFYNDANILGTVSQSGGVPTGAIIERGSNANGEFVRYADGTQICWKDNVSCVYVTTASLIYDASYPAAFIATPSLNANLFSPFDYNGTQYTSAQVADGVTRPLLRSFGDSSTRISFNIQRPSPSQSWNSDDDLKANFTAIGRWY